MDDYSRIVDYVVDSKEIPCDFRNAVKIWIAERADDSRLEQSMRCAWERVLERNRNNYDTEGLPEIMDEIDPGWDKSVMDAYIGKGRNLPIFRRFSKSLKYAAMAALVVLAAVVSYIAVEHYSNDQVILLTSKGSTGEFSLPDGTRVLLNSDSRLTYSNNDFKRGKCREVTLEGEAYFDVTHDAACPFRVEMSGLCVEVLGTSFDVKNYESSPLKEVVLLSGKVKVEETTGERQKVVLNPDQRYIYDSETNKSIIENTSAIDYCNWHLDQLKIENEPLRKALITISRKYCMDLEIDPGVEVDKQITITVKNEPIEDVMTTISYLADFDYEISDHRLIIRNN